MVSAPVIQAQIFTNGQITGTFTVEETQELSLILRAGALPAPLIVLEERSVGPGLGADSISAGQIAAVVGMIMVIIYMVASYGLFGSFAVGALFVNIILILGALSALQATLTLPGIAGIVLTMGMAVDANVLIFERVREELRTGRKIRAAIEAGYKRAISTIIDSNLTTLFAALFLFIFGTGPIKGFAVTLSLGILTPCSQRLWLHAYLLSSGQMQKSQRAGVVDRKQRMFRLKLVPDNSAFDFLRQMRLTAAFSAMLVLVSIGLFWQRAESGY